MNTPPFGIPIITSRALADGLVVKTGEAILIGTRPPTAFEDAGREGRLMARRGLARWVEYIGEKVENEPTGQQVLTAIKLTGFTS